MTYRAAFASSDGKVINQHFGRAAAFHIADIDDEKKTVRFIESRECAPVCSDFSHSQERLDETAELLSDCRAVFAAQIGMGARQTLGAHGIQGIEMPYFIEDVTDALMNSKVKIIQDDFRL